MSHCAYLQMVALPVTEFGDNSHHLTLLEIRVRAYVRKVTTGPFTIALVDMGIRTPRHDGTNHT